MYPVPFSLALTVVTFAATDVCNVPAVYCDRGFVVVASSVQTLPTELLTVQATFTLPPPQTTFGGYTVKLLTDAAVRDGIGIFTSMLAV